MQHRACDVSLDRLLYWKNTSCTMSCLDGQVNEALKEENVRLRDHINYLQVRCIAIIANYTSDET